MNVIAHEIQNHWHVIRPLFMIHTEDEYDMAIERLNQLIDEVEDDERHPLYDLLDTLGTIIHAYEERHYPISDCSGGEMLRFFMDEHGLTVSDLPELGSEIKLTKIINGDQELTVKQIRSLSERFKVSPAVFI